MFRIRLHGRGGQGTKTAGRILGRAFFLDGHEVQDAPLYGAERRGAPVVAYVRADSARIDERGIILTPDLAVVIDESLLRAPQAKVLLGLGPESVLLIHGRRSAEDYRRELGILGPVLALPALDARAAGFAAVFCVGGAARLLGVTRDGLRQAVAVELAALGEDLVRQNLERAAAGYAHFAAQHGSVLPQRVPSPLELPSPDWIELPLERSELSAPAIHARGTSATQPTGLWRTERPVVDAARCHHCHWVCGSACPDGVISAAADGSANIDLVHCKGCMICVRECPWHAIGVLPEQGAAA